MLCTGIDERLCWLVSVYGLYVVCIMYARFNLLKTKTKKEEEENSTQSIRNKDITMYFQCMCSVDVDNENKRRRNREKKKLSCYRGQISKWNSMAKK